MFDDFGTTFLRLDLAQAEVNVVLIARIIEVAKEISFDSEIPVVDGTTSGPFACGSEVSLHSRSARVEDAHCVCIFRPLAAENFLQCIRQLLKGRSTSASACHSEFAEPSQQ